MNLTRKHIESRLTVFAGLMACCYAASWAARLHWAADLSSHFTLQYAIGGFAFGIAFIVLRRFGWAALCMAIMAANIVNFKPLMDDPWAFQAPGGAADFTMVQYNKLYRNHHYGAMRAWFAANAGSIDILFVQESGPDTIEDLKQFRDLFPYQFPENASQRFNDVSILSRFPFSVTPAPLTKSQEFVLTSRVEIKKAGMEEPLVIYSYHTITPMSFKTQKRRNIQLARLARAVKNDAAERVIASGDWNITPWSPYFADFLKESGLHYQNFGIVPETSWPSFFLLPFLKIPIDHVLYSDGLELIDLKRGPAMGSDHHPLVAKFRVMQ